MNYETQFAGGMAIADYEEEAARRRKRRLILIVVVVAVVALIIAAIAISRSRAAADAAAAASTATQVPVVTVLSPGQSSVKRTVTATGSLAARVEMPVSVLGEGGQVSRVLVQPGDWVREGQVLAVIERSVQSQQSRALAAQIEVARADARLAQAELDRAKQLVGRGFISQADIDRKTATRDSADAQVGVAVAQLNEQNARNGRLDIRAPAAGLILTRAVEPGQVVGSSSGVLFRMARNGEMELLAQLSEADLARVKVGIPATVTPVGSTASIAGHVWQVSPVVNAQSRQGLARIAIPYTSTIRPGGFAAVTIVSGSGDAPLLPESAVQTDENGNYVYVVNASDHVERHPVTVGQVSGDGVAVTAGLTGREKIVASAGAFLTPGQKVRPELQKPGK